MFPCLVPFVCFASSLAATLPERLIVARQDPTPTAGVPAAQSTKCGAIVTDANNGSQLFWASDAYECLSSVPFNPAVASRFVQYWNETIQFQSTLAYLKSPPEGYQQPAVDVLDDIAKIQQRIDAGFYGNQYAFEADFQLLLHALHDGHVTVTGGALSAFTFAAPFEIASVSIDGKQAPKVYVTDDIIKTRDQQWTSSPINTINGEDVVEYLTKFSALNSWGYVEPHADWNALTSSPALDIQGGLTVFGGGATFYPGDKLIVHFENYTEGDDTTKIDTHWLAIYNELANYTGPLTTGGDFYNYFVLGNLPASFDPSTVVPPKDSPNSNGSITDWSDDSEKAYPMKPAVGQYDLRILGGGIVTGYFYEDISTGILSLPSFDAASDTIGNYTKAVVDFIKKASTARLHRVIIDLQRNPGGSTLLAYTTFKSFFPDLMPFGGSRRRIFPLANALGSATSNFFNILDEDDAKDLATKQEIAAYEWIVTNRINAASGRNFTSWAEYEGPINDNGDSFSLTEQYDLANEVWDHAAFDEWAPTMYLPDQSEWALTKRSWDPDQIVLLTDGLCASACSLFAEMMTRAGVKTVVAGGRPTSGPMQGVGGNRGATVYSAFDLDDDMLYARANDQWVDEAVNNSIPEVREPGIYLKWASINLRDQVRKEETTPLQFKYEAADCRIYYTLANLYNMTRLWHDVAAAAFEDTSLCVEGSIGFSTTNNTSPNPPPKPETERPALDHDNPVVEQVEFDEDPTGGLRDGYGKPIGGNDITICPPSGFCANGRGQCKRVKIFCSENVEKEVHACLPYCSNHQGSKSCPGSCVPSAKQESKIGLGHRESYASDLYTGLCYPKTGTTKLGCPKNHSKLS